MDVVRANAIRFQHLPNRNVCVCVWFYVKLRSHRAHRLTPGKYCSHLLINFHTNIRNTNWEHARARVAVKYANENNNLQLDAFSRYSRIEKGYQWSELHCHQLRWRSIIIRLLAALCVWKEVPMLGTSTYHRWVRVEYHKKNDSNRNVCTEPAYLCHVVEVGISSVFEQIIIYEKIICLHFTWGKLVECR